MRLNRFLTVSGVSAGLALCGVMPGLASAASTQSPPVVHEQSTLLPCPPKPTTTPQIEGCAEHKLVALDKKIDALNARIYAKLTKAGRGDFIATNTDWVTYRNEACTAEASIYSGGTIQPIVYANCEVSIDGTHLTELKGILLDLSPEG